jgi:hypothetical protein
VSWFSRNIVLAILYGANSRAWSLLPHIIPDAQTSLPQEMVSWAMEESAARDPSEKSIPSDAERLIQEVNEFKMRFEKEVGNSSTRDTQSWTRGWKKWEGEWTPSPIGILYPEVK